MRTMRAFLVLTTVAACGGVEGPVLHPKDAAIGGNTSGTGGSAIGTAGSGGSNADAALGSGGATGGAGGTVAPDAPASTGGLAGQSGGTLGSGGKVGTGGASGTGQTGGSGGAAGGSGGSARGGSGGGAGGNGGSARTGGSGGSTGGVGGTARTGGSGGGAGGSGGSARGGSGGAAGAGGATLGGASGTGGMGGSGGATSTGGSTSKTCGGLTYNTCPSGQFCDVASNCGQISRATGTCALTGASLFCADDVNPVCGCDGKTYSSDCARRIAGMLKAADGACSGDGGVRSYPTAYLAWQASAGTPAAGPAVVVSGEGWVDTWSSVQTFPPETPPSSTVNTYNLAATQVDDLFARLAAVNMSSLPHCPCTAVATGCSLNLYFRLCEGCTATTLNCEGAPQIAPEMDTVWLWFDQVLTASAATNPRNYCSSYF